MNKCLRLASILSLSCLVSTSALAAGWGKYFLGENMSKSKTCTYENVKAKVSLGKSVCTSEFTITEGPYPITVCGSLEASNYIKNTSKDNATADVRAVWQNTETRKNSVTGYRAKTYYDLKAGEKKEYASTKIDTFLPDPLSYHNHACRVGKDN